MRFNYNIHIGHNPLQNMKVIGLVKIKSETNICIVVHLRLSYTLKVFAQFDIGPKLLKSNNVATIPNHPKNKKLNII